MRIGTFALLASFLSAVPAFPADVAPPATKGIDTSFSVPENRPILCKRVATLQGDMKIASPAGEMKMKFSAEADMEFIDTHTVLKKEKEKGTRHFVAAHSKVNGEIDDPPLAGITAAYQSGKDGVELTIDNDRILPKPELDYLLEDFKTLSVWLGFPDDAAIGQSYPVDFSYVGSILFSNELKVESGDGTVVLESFDEATGAASFRASCEIAQRGTIDGVTMAVTYKLAGAVRTNVNERRIVSLALKGTFTMKREGAPPTTGEGTCSTELATEIGDVVAKARARKPTFRERTFLVSAYGVRFSLPSYWGRLPKEKDMQQYVRGIGAEKGEVYIILQPLEGPTAKPKEFYDSLGKELKKITKAVKTVNVTSPLGAGRAYLFETEVEGKAQKMRAEAYPVGRRFVLYKLQAPPHLYAAAEKEFAAARKTLKRYELSAH